MGTPVTGNQRVPPLEVGSGYRRACVVQAAYPVVIVDRDFGLGVLLNNGIFAEKAGSAGVDKGGWVGAQRD